MGCAAGAAPDEYRESQGHVARFSVKQVDEVLRVAVFVERTDGARHRARIFHYQAHKTLIGVRKVEKGARMTSITAKQKPVIFLPMRDDVQSYLLLISKPIPRENTKEEPKWTDWCLLEVPADDVTRTKTLTIPAYSELCEMSDNRKKLLKELVPIFEKAHAEAVKKMNEPIRHDTKVPWWGW